MSAEAHCKGCGGPMTEGRAYELGNHRWHVECFRCSNCKDQLTAHTNMLVLGDGTLVCANCSYTCAVCSKKIMDMAVLTNDQAFCASCFVCRNCKKRIDDLQYARTSQGIFCMTCHNALLARKRQRQLQRQQLQKQTPQQTPLNTPPQQQHQQHYQSNESSVERDHINEQFPGGSGFISNHGSVSNPTSSKSSIVSSSSFNRHKDLPELPGDTVVSPVDYNKDFDALTVKPERPQALRQLSEGKESRQLRVPRKKLAPSAFQNYESDPTINSSISDSTARKSESPVDESSRDTSQSSVRMIPRDTSRDFKSELGRSLSSDPTDNSKQVPKEAGEEFANELAKGFTKDNVTMPHRETSPISAFLGPPIGDAPLEESQAAASGTPASVSTTSREETPVQQTPISYKLANSVFEPRSIGTPPISPMKSEGLTPETSRSSGTPAYSSRDGHSGLNVPVRSQLRPVSPSKPWMSPGNSSDYSPRPASSHRSPGFASSVPFDRITASPTQAAPTQQAKSPFGRLWHRRDKSTVSTDSNDLPHAASTSLMQGHKRSASENNTSETTSSSYHEDVRLTEALSALSIERVRLSDAERKLEQYEQRENLEAELSRLSQQVTKMRDEQKLLSSRNTQLIEMNAELERRTLEKFGPNSLWGSQNPAPLSSHEQQTHTAPANNASANVKEMPKESPLVTRLDDPPHSSYSSGGNAQQAQFLPFKTAKQWFFRRPNRPTGSGNDRIQPVQLSQLTQMAQNGNAGNGDSSAPGSSQNSVNQKGGYNAQNSILGDSLSYRVQVDQAPVPYFVTRCFAEVERRGLDTEGVYRKPGSKSQVDSILEQFGPNGDPALGEELLGGDIQAVTSAVKQYLRRLAEPVITYDCYEVFVAAGNSKNMDLLRKGIQSLPSEHLATLRAIALHLAQVASHEPTNLMNTRNLAMVFAPTIARDESGDREIPDMQARNEATHMLIVNSDTLLNPIDELL